jgi:hypothetical protein
MPDQRGNPTGSGCNFHAAARCFRRGRVSACLTRGRWQRLAGALTRRGNRVQAVDLPTGQPELLAADYAVLAAGQVAGTMDHPVVVAHSGGCLLLPAIAREVGARRLVWLAGYIPGPAGGPSFAGEIKAACSEMFSPE